MRKLLLILTTLLFLGFSVNAQTASTDKTSTTQKTDEKPTKQIFRAGKEQISQAQKMLKVKESGKIDDETRAAANACFFIS